MYSFEMQRVVLGVDCRRVRLSGIGTYLSNTLSGLITGRPQWHWHLFGRPDELADLVALAPERIEVSAFSCALYSIREHFYWATANTQALDLLWVPHYTVPLYCQTPVVCTIHDVIQLAHPEIFRGWAMQAYARIFMELARRSHAVAFLSDFTRAEFHRLVGRPIGPSGVTLAGVEERWFTGKEGQRATDGRPTIVYVGNVRPHKNLRRLVEAFSLIKDKIPHDLIVIGKEQGIIRGDKDAFLLGRSLGGRVTFTGWVDDDCLLQLIAKADLLVMPSIYEGFGLPPLEAMAIGCPVAMSRRAAMPEVGGGAALYFDPFDVNDMAGVILRAVGDRSLNAYLVQAGQSRARAFPWSHTVQVMGDLLEKVLEKRTEIPRVS